MYKPTILVTIPSHDDTTRLEGKTTGQAYTISQNSFREKIRNLLTSESKAEQSSMMRFLIWDMKHQVCLGNKNAKI